MIGPIWVDAQFPKRGRLPLVSISVPRLILAAAVTVAVLMLVVLPRHVDAGEIVTVQPAEDTAAVLSNPDMGWVLYENYPLDPRAGGSSTLVALPNETFPRVDLAALMFAWSDVETRQGKYDFSKVDFAYDHWRKLGKRIQLRLSSETLLWWNHLEPPSGVGAPAYVLEHMTPAQKQTRTLSGCKYVVVDARNRYYQERLAKFLKAVADHFNDERPVELVDLRGFGVWGEWHTGFQFKSLEDRREALKRVIDIYSAAFPKHWVALSASYDPDSPKELWDGSTKQFDPAFTKTYDAFLRWGVFDYALTKPNVTWRRDGAGGAVHSNERKLMSESFATCRKGPMMAEFVDGYADSLKGGEKWVRWKIDDALSLHPNYINLLGWQGGDGLAFLKEEPDLIEHGLRTMGYRLVPTRVRYPTDILASERFRVESEWVNRGVGRAMRDYHLCLMLADENGKTLATTDAGELNTHVWVQGETYKTAKDLAFQSIARGAYQLRITLIDPRDRRSINLPLTRRGDDGSYPIGAIHCR